MRSSLLVLLSTAASGAVALSSPSVRVPLELRQSSMVHVGNLFGGWADVRRRLVGSLNHLGKVNQEENAKRRKQNKKRGKKERHALKLSMSPEEHAKHLAKLALDQDREAAEAAVIRAERDLLDIAIVKWIEDQGTLKLDIFKDKHKTEGGLVFDEVRVTGNPYFLRKDLNHCVVKRHWVEDNVLKCRSSSMDDLKGRNYIVKDYKGEFMLVHARDVLSEDGKNSVLLHAEYYIKEKRGGWVKGGAGDGVLNLQQIRGALRNPKVKAEYFGSLQELYDVKGFEPGRMEYTNKDGELKLFQSGEPASVFNYLGIFVQNQCVDALAQNQCVDALATITKYAIDAAPGLVDFHAGWGSVGSIGSSNWPSP